MHRYPLDRKKLELLKRALPKISDLAIQVHHVAPIIQEFDFDSSKLSALKLLCPLLPEEAYPSCVKLLRFYPDRTELIKSLNETHQE